MEPDDISKAAERAVPQANLRNWTPQYKEAAFKLRRKGYTWSQAFDFISARANLSEDMKATFIVSMSRQWKREEESNE